MQTAIDVIKTGQPQEFGLPAVIWKGTNASNAVTVRGGSFGAAIFGGEAATILTYYQTGGSALLGAGCTLGTLTVDGGTLEINSAITALTVTGGEVVINGTGAIGTLTVLGGRVRCLTHGTITTLVVGGRGQATVDFSDDNTARTVSATTINLGGEILLVPGSITFTAPPIVGGNVSQLSAA